MNKKELNVILKRHEMWSKGKYNGIHANLRGADLRGADLEYADLYNVKVDFETVGYHIECPEEGEFIGYKKANNCIIKLLILNDAKRSSATTKKCRCDKVKVLDIENITTHEKVECVSSNYGDFIYRVGEIVKIDDFDNDRWNERGTGIHFFMNKENALTY